jgi:predicted dehydrogenase
MKKKVLIVGAGAIALEYVKIFNDLQWEICVVGRSKKTVDELVQICDFNKFSGGIKAWLENNNISDYQAAVVAVTGDQLDTVTGELLQAGCKNILLEKPGASDFAKLEVLAQASEEQGANVRIAYNRRFYSSVLKAQELIEQDGGVVSFNFEFTEWSHVISKLDKPTVIKANWLFHNSSHVIDMAFSLGGWPKDLSAYTSGEVEWHKPSVFAGAGISTQSALFSYHANWETAGRWVVEVLTRKRRLIFKPLEKLQVQEIGSIQIQELELNDDIDIKYKPGFFRQVEAFVHDDPRIPTIGQLNDNIIWLKKIAGFGL